MKTAQVDNTKVAFDRFTKTHYNSIQSALDTALDFKLGDARETLKEAIRYSVLAKAKRIRPLLVLATHQLFNGDTTSIMPVACAMEMVHAYSLIHDDLPAMDDDDYRRGQLTCHKKYGEDIAILAGDTLNTFAFELVADALPSHFDNGDIIWAIKEMANAFGINGMSGGQVLDLVGNSDQASLEQLVNTHNRKTGTLIHACLTIPAKLNKATEKEQELLSHFGKQIGLLFQIIDDILDVTQEKDELGKTPNKDIEQNKLTFISLLGLKEAKKSAKEIWEKAHLSLKSMSDRNAENLAIILDYIYYRNH
jgi:geranylgeranyl diphosphate synthase, type II